MSKSFLGDAEWEIRWADTVIEGRNVVQECFAFLFRHNVVLEVTLSIIYNLYTNGTYHVKVPPHAVLRPDPLDWINVPAMSRGFPLFKKPRTQLTHNVNQQLRWN